MVFKNHVVFFILIHKRIVWLYTKFENGRGKCRFSFTSLITLMFDISTIITAYFINPKNACIYLRWDNVICLCDVRYMYGLNLSMLKNILKLFWKAYLKEFVQKWYIFDSECLKSISMYTGACFWDKSSPYSIIITVLYHYNYCFYQNTLFY